MEEPVGYLLKRVQQTLRLRMDEVLRKIGLTTAQYAALSALESSDNLSNADLARACFVTPQTMIEILQGLQAGGEIVRRPHPHHKRVLTTALTAGGAEKLAAAHQAVYGIEEQMLLGLSQSERHQLAELLVRCVHNLTS